MSPRPRALLALLVLLIGGCCAHRFDKPASPITDGKELSERVRKATATVKSFELHTRMERYGDDGALKGKVDIVGKRPDRVRFEALTPTDDTILVVISDGRRFMSHERGKQECLVGDATPANIARLLLIPFAGEQLFELVVGGAPLIEHDTAEAGWHDCEGTYLLTLTRGDVVEEIWLRPDNYLPVKIRLTEKGKERFVIELDDHEALDGYPLARRLQYKSPVGDTDLSVDVRKAWLNKVDSDKIFQPLCPPGTSPREVR